MGASGGPAMASQAQAALSSCPDTKLVLAGYSYAHSRSFTIDDFMLTFHRQGAMVVRAYITG